MPIAFSLIASYKKIYTKGYALVHWLVKLLHLPRITKQLLPWESDYLSICTAFLPWLIRQIRTLKVEMAKWEEEEEVARSDWPVSTRHPGTSIQNSRLRSEMVAENRGLSEFPSSRSKIQYLAWLTMGWLLRSGSSASSELSSLGCWYQLGSVVGKLDRSCLVFIPSVATDRVYVFVSGMSVMQKREFETCFSSWVEKDALPPWRSRSPIRPAFPSCFARPCGKASTWIPRWRRCQYLESVPFCKPSF